MDDIKDAPQVILEKFPGLPLTLFFCPECRDPCKASTNVHPYDKLSHILQCSNKECQGRWILCSTVCESQRTHIRDSVQFNMHKGRCPTRQKLLKGQTIVPTKKPRISSIATKDQSVDDDEKEEIKVEKDKKTKTTTRKDTRKELTQKSRGDSPDESLLEATSSPPPKATKMKELKKNLKFTEAFAGKFCVGTNREYAVVQKTNVANDESTRVKEQILEEIQNLDMITRPLFSDNDLLPPTFTKFSGDCNQKYFEQEHFGRGAAYLVSMSSFHHYDPSMKIDHNEIALQLNIARLVNTLSRDQKSLFGNIIGNVIHSVVRRNMTAQYSPDAEFLFPALPRNGEEVRSLYVEGKFALLNNVPRPLPRMLSNHVVVDVFDCLADFLGHGIPCRSIPSISWFKTQVALEGKKRKADETSEFLTVP